MSASACTRSMLILLITLIAMINVFLWPPYVIGQGIYFHPVVSSSSFFLLFFPRLISAVTHRMSTFHTWFGHSANLQCRSDMCCMWLAQNTGRKKPPKIRHLGTITQLCRAVSSQIRHTPTIRKKLVKHQYLLQMSPQYGKLRLTSG